DAKDGCLGDRRLRDQILYTKRGYVGGLAVNHDAPDHAGNVLVYRVAMEYLIYGRESRFQTLQAFGGHKTWRRIPLFGPGFPTAKPEEREQEWSHQQSHFIDLAHAHSPRLISPCP